ncbi:HAD family hydrolase [Clostridium perfringens]|uniref:HAD family hydrolase n=1 Tax=Clostridium perfringens TaxID=1502 RepID=UPI001C8503E2|nr:HAD family hydrolase [Clostridium perfringens]MCX0371380.1 HAD family hydrolase [Clostridium perfringens]
MENLKGIIFFDVDGTLIDCGKGLYKPSNKTKEAIKKLKDNGYLTILATGRPMSFVDDGLKELELDGYIASNGTYIELNNEVILNDDIKLEKLKEIMDYCVEHNINFILEGQKTSYVLNNDVAKKMVENFSLPEESFTGDWTEDELSANKLVIVDNNKEDFKDIFERFKDEFVFMQHPGHSSYDMYRRGCTKAHGIEHLIKKLGLSDKDTYAFGDGENDIEMFQRVKYGIAMGDAHETLIPHAYKQTENVPNEGIYKALLELGLI